MNRPQDVLWDAARQWSFMDRRIVATKPGQWLEHYPEDSAVRQALRRLKSEDIANVRPDAIWLGP